MPVITGWQGWVYTAGMCVMVLQVCWLSISRRNALRHVAELEKALEARLGPGLWVDGPLVGNRYGIRRTRHWVPAESLQPPRPPCGGAGVARPARR